MRKLLALTLVLVAASSVNAQLNLFYDVRPTIAEIDSPVAPWIYTASLSPYAPYIGQNYPAGNPASPGIRGDGAMLFVSPKIHDVTDWTGIGPTDEVDEHLSLMDPTYDWSVGKAYLYAEFLGDNATEVVSSIGINQNTPADAFAAGRINPDTGATYHYLRSLSNTSVNDTLWTEGAGVLVTGSEATVTMKYVNVAVKNIGGTPSYDIGTSLQSGQTACIADLNLETEYKDVGVSGSVGIYDVMLTETSPLITRTGYPVAAAALPFNFGYAGGAPESGTANTEPDLRIVVVRKGDYDLDGAAATGVDDYAYYAIAADASMVNPYEMWLGDFDKDGYANTALDDFDYFKHAFVP